MFLVTMLFTWLNLLTMMIRYLGGCNVGCDTYLEDPYFVQAALTTITNGLNGSRVYRGYTHPYKPTIIFFKP